MKSIWYRARASALAITLGVLALVRTGAACPLFGTATDSISAGAEKRLMPAFSGHISILVCLNSIEQEDIQSRLNDFSFGNTDLGGAHPFRFLFGLNRASNGLELELSFAIDELYDFMDSAHEFHVNETRFLLWYRREWRFRLGGATLGVSPGAGMGYSLAMAVVGCTAEYCQVETESGMDNDETAVLEASGFVYGLGVRLDAPLTSWHTGPGVSFIDLILELGYRFDDLPAKTINDGGFFFPAPTEFTTSGHYIEFGLQWRYGEW